VSRRRVIRNARGMVGRISAWTSAVLPSMCSGLKFGAKSVSASRKVCRPAASWRTSCGLMSLVLPTSALPPAGGVSRFPPEQLVNTSAAIMVCHSKASSLHAHRL